jgi:hypothetical protein
MKSFKQLVEGLVEAWPGTKEYEDKFGKPKGMSDDGKRKGARHDIEVKDGVTKATKRFDDEDHTEAKPTEKRGRGRPAGKYGQYKKSVKESLEIMESMQSEDEIAEFIDSLDEESFEQLEAFLQLDEEEQLDELSKDTLNSYRAQATGSAIMHHHSANNTRDADKIEKHSAKAQKRMVGASRAYQKTLTKEDFELDEAVTPKGHTIEAHGIKGMKGTPWRKTFKSHDHLSDWAEKNDSVEVHGTRDLEKPKQQKESVEQIDELSKTTLGSYVKKANQSAMSAAHAVGSKRGAASDEHINKMFKRKAGVNKAVDRLTKEDVELVESHFSLGDTVKCKESGMTGKVVKLDKEHGDETEKYYTVERSDGKTVKYAPSELSLVTENITHPNQKVLDKNKNGKIDKEDFKILRGEKEKNESFVDSIASLITKQSKGEA